MKLPLISQPKGKPEPRAGPLQIMQRKLAQNALTEFKIGFEGDEFRSKRDVQSLINTIQGQYLQKLAMDKISCLESVRIGWRLPRFALAPVLQEVVPMLLQQPARVQTLQLMMFHAWVPLPTMERLVSWHTLETLDLRSIRIRTRTVSEPRQTVDRGGPLLRRHGGLHGLSSSASSVGRTKGNALVDLSVDDHGGIITADDRVLAALPFMSPSIKTLKLVDCDLQVEDMPDLIQILRKKRHIQLLSLRHNRRLYMNGWEQEMLQKMPFLKGLDLSICDLDPIDGIRLARALKDRNKGGLKGLCVSGNYRLSEAVPQLVEACATTGVAELNCSFCDVQNQCQHQVFEILATIQPCSLRSLRMQSVRVKDPKPLIRCIELNTSLQRLILDHPREPFDLPSHAMDALLEAVRNNYYLHAFRFDPPWNIDAKVLEEMGQWMTLNRCGRSILVDDSSKYWPRVLSNAANLGDPDKFFWILQNGANLF